MSLEIRQSFPSSRLEPFEHDSHAFSYLQKKMGGNALMQSTMMINTAVEQLHTSFPLDADNDAFAADSVALRSRLDQTEAHLDHTPRYSEMIDYFRLASSHDFAVDSAAVKAAFSSIDERELRESIVNGLTGISVARMEQALTLYDNTRNPFRRTDLRGVIAEQLALTLTNFTENPDRIALPAALSQDILEETDINIYYFVGELGVVAPAQVKSGFAQKAPVNGININRRALGYYNDHFKGLNPKQDFQLVRALIKMTNGQELNEAEMLVINTSVMQFNKYLDKQATNRAGNIV